DVVGHQLRAQLGTLDLLDVDRGFLAGQLSQLVPQLVHLGAPLANDHTGTAGMHRDGDLTGTAVDINLGDRRMAQTGLQVLPDQLVFLEERRHLLGGVPPGGPLLDDPEPEPDRMGLLPHYSLSLVATWIST